MKGDTTNRTHMTYARHGVRRGFTIIEVIVIVVILGVLAAVIAPRLLSRIGGAKQSTAAMNASSLAGQLHGMAADMGKMPEAGASIMILWENPGEGSGWKGPYIQNADELKDPWGNLFILVIPGQKNVDFDVVSYGADGQPGGDGENADIIKP
jgi:general secretion pathway protein G